MADVTGGSAPTNASPFDVAGDIQDVYDHFGDPSMFKVATIAGLPASGNWSGRQLFVEEDGSVRRWTGSVWRVESVVAAGYTAISYPANRANPGFGYAVGFRLTPHEIFLSGTVEKTTGNWAAADVVLTLPVGARPTQTQYSVQAGSATSLISLQWDGTGVVTVRQPPTASTSWLSLDGVVLRRA